MSLLLWTLKIGFFLVLVAGTVTALADGEYLYAFTGGAFTLFYSFFAFTEPEYLDSFLPEEEGENRG